MFDDYAGKQFTEAKRLIDALNVADLRAIADLLGDAWRQDRTLYLVGNGGSAATAAHWANDLGKGASVEGKKRFRVVSLCDNISTITALGNDLSFDDIFVEQLKNLMNPGDVLIGISCSGNSENIVRAVEYARQNGGKTIGVLGFGGGKMKNLCDRSVVVDSYDYGLVESLHLLVEHVVSFFFKERLSSEAKP